MAINSAAIRWHDDHLELLDQRRLPAETVWLPIHGSDDAAAAIRDMVVRGAPAIGITAAYGLALEAARLGDDATASALAPAIAALAASRPTAVNLFWALERLQTVAGELSGASLINALKADAQAIHEEDLAANQRMGELGADLLPDNASVYTHCNTGALATGGHGTALGIIRTAWSRGTLQEVYAGETRPWLQGSRLTSWELLNDDIPVTLVADSAAGQLMQQGKIQAVIVGADRITANGDTANKIGTYNLAVLARHHGIPFIVAAPLSTLDAELPDGSHIVIEERDASEVRNIQGKTLAPAHCPVYNPAFDVTPAELISAIVTERGVIRNPTTDTLMAHLRG
ncbi:S-methyl-5-thioribose-1-phosphate isomerase [Alcanivorax sp.]|jgi:methylthioribose-1-phosphate isomerase|uniref:S-methyl-5-thioribose-1-phosphate isomerase n=1 Tax=Alcanivorax sp. TaxID=1872427 RepID=UPI0019AE9390|nr:S-methyl-5-thioribose-1-phosphate isomerase [Alcanivorax sp.]MBD3642807.1 S-methyl-5-thioribose-1-phosphate isomerase [Alcanivorax sp.]